MPRKADPPDITSPAGLQNVPADILAQALGRLADSKASDAEVIHDFRRAMKRWRAILRLLEPYVGDDGAALRTEARDLARELAGARDLRAALDALEDLGQHASLSPRSRASIKAQLEGIGALTEAASLAPEMRDRLRDALAAAAEVAKHWPYDQIGFGQIADELTHSYRRARDAVPADWSAASTGDLHELRKRLVAHRHQMELVVPLWPKLGKLWINEAQRLRERLGQHQDLGVLASYAQAHQPLAPWLSRLGPLITERQGEHVAAAARLAGRLFAEKPRAFRQRLLALWKHRADRALSPNRKATASRHETA